MTRRRCAVPTLWIWLAYAAVTVVGLLSLPPMVGDEVTHFYLLSHQAEELPAPTFRVLIPAPWAETTGLTQRDYPHAILWHYLMAIPYRLLGRQIWLLQVLHGLFLVQLLYGVRYALSRGKGGVLPHEKVAVLVAASQPLTLLLGVTFYQEVPATAQAVWAFALLAQRRWLAGAVFLAVCLNIKENMILLLPAYGLAMLWLLWRDRRELLKALCVTTLLVAGSCALTAGALARQGFTYFPLDNLKVVRSRMLNQLEKTVGRDRAAPGPDQAVSGAAAEKPSSRSESLYSPEVIAHNPGDLRRWQNWVIYGGGVLPAVLIAAAVAAVVIRKRLPCGRAGAVFAFAGGSFLALNSWLLHTAPDARFFYTGLILTAVPLASAVSRLPFRKVWIPLLCAVALFQGGAVLAKTYQLRHVPAGVQEAIGFLAAHRPTPGVVFMYPEGNYRLFPVETQWYLSYKLKDLWKGDNNRRIEILREHFVGAIVVKKHLIGELDSEMNNLGIYPRAFVQDIRDDTRFERVFENEAVVIFTVPWGSTPDEGH